MWGNILTNEPQTLDSCTRHDLTFHQIILLIVILGSKI